MIQYFYFQSITRKISGKTGNFIEALLRMLCDDNSELAEFDLKKTIDSQVVHLEIKSSTNTMRKAEMKKFFLGDSTKEKNWGVIPKYQLEHPNHVFKLGTSFGEKNHPEHLRSIEGYISKMLSEYKGIIKFNDEKRIHLCGNQLWDYLSQQNHFLSNVLFPILLKAKEEFENSSLSKLSIGDAINKNLKQIKNEFTKKYGDTLTPKMIINNLI